MAHLNSRYVRSWFSLAASMVWSLVLRLLCHRRWPVLNRRPYRASSTGYLNRIGSVPYLSVNLRLKLATELYPTRAAIDFIGSREVISRRRASELRESAITRSEERRVGKECGRTC